MATNHKQRRKQLEAELATQQAACKAALSMIEHARERMRAPRAQMAAGYETLRECRTRIRQIKRELRALRG